VGERVKTNKQARNQTREKDWKTGWKMEEWDDLMDGSPSLEISFKALQFVTVSFPSSFRRFFKR